MIYDLDILEDYVSRGLIQYQTHPYLPLRIYNYTRDCQYNREWDEITLNCRGLVVEVPTGKVIAKPFTKFFNYEELEHTEEIPWGDEKIVVMDKLDGSLGIIFYYAGKWHVATKGSFTSDQAVKGKEMFDNYKTDRLDKDNTYLVEIIY